MWRQSSNKPWRRLCAFFLFIYQISKRQHKCDRLQIFIDWLPFQMNTSPGTWSMRPGLTTIKLVAYNGACTDTAVSYYFYPGTFPSKADNASRLYGYEDRGHEVSDITNVRSGGYVITGRRVGSSLYNEHQQGLIIKTKEEGCVEWARKLAGGYQADIKLVKEAAGGGFFILAEVDYNKQFIAKLDVSGNLQWAKSLMGTSGSSAEGYGIGALPDGGAAIVGSYPNTAKYLVTRLSDY